MVDARRRVSEIYTTAMHGMVSNSVFQYIDKELVARRFAHARSTYDREAGVQRQVAVKMMHLLTDALLAQGTPPEEVPARFRHIVELGCGTGSYSRLLADTLRPETLLLNDLCPEMEENVGELCHQPDCRQAITGDAEAKPAVRFLPGDAELLDFPPGTDLITSCSTLQWFADTERFFSRCHRFLTDDGILAFTTFGKENMHEIHALTGNGLNYLPLESLKVLLSPRFDILYAEEEIVSLPFDTPLQVLQHLKLTGVTGTEKRMWTRGRLQAFCEEYTTRFGDESRKVPLTYHPIYMIAKKK